MPARKEAVEGMVKMLEEWSKELHHAKNKDVAALAVELHSAAARLRGTVEAWPRNIGSVVGVDSEPVKPKYI